MGFQKELQKKLFRTEKIQTSLEKKRFRKNVKNMKFCTKCNIGERLNLFSCIPKDTEHIFEEKLNTSVALETLFRIMQEDVGNSGYLSNVYLEKLKKIFSKV